MSTLRASAAEFVPTDGTCTGVHPVIDTPAEQQDLHEDPEHWQAQYYGDGFYDELGNWVFHDFEAAAYQAADIQSQSWQDNGGDSTLQDPWAAAPSSTDTTGKGADGWGGLSVSTVQAVGLLHTWYPDQSKPMLQQLYEACNYQLQDTLNILAEMEAEQTPTVGHISAAAGKAAEETPARLAGQQVQDWPSLALAAAQRADDPGRAQRDSIGSSTWATVAKKAAATAAPASGPVTGKAGLDSRLRQPLHHSTSSQPAAQQVPWVTTGTAVAQEYADARAQASDYARVRNACFHQATIAYLAGNKALAKDLSAQGKHAAQKMWEAHQRASQQIFIQRNANLPCATAHKAQRVASISNTSVIDLHGLHVREVQAELPQQLAALTAQNQSAVNIIVGVGKHTKGPPGPRLLPAAEAILQEMGYSYRQPQPGLLRVHLRPQ